MLLKKKPPMAMCTAKVVTTIDCRACAWPQRSSASTKRRPFRLDQLEIHRFHRLAQLSRAMAGYPMLVFEAMGYEEHP
jgi:hypothetical protein